MRQKGLRKFLMKTKIAILLPYKENYSSRNSGAVSIWVKDYLNNSKLSKSTIVFGNLEKKNKPLTKNFFNISMKDNYFNKNLQYTKKFYEYYQKHKFDIIEIHNRPESLIYLINKKVKAKLIFIFHNDPLNLRYSISINERLFIAKNTDQIFFVSKWAKNRFFEDLPFKNKNNCEILYPAIKQVKNFPKKERIIIFSGKLNSSKGYSLFGNSIIKILDSFKKWKAIAVGNEPREKFYFKHERLEIIPWLKHEDILKLYAKSSISIVPSIWQEPFGRTAMESSSYGCAVITSKNGGLPETLKKPIILKKLNTREIINIVSKLIKNRNNLKKIQRYNFQNQIHTLDNQIRIIDNLKSFYLKSNFYIKKNKKLKILHVSTFDERNDHRLFNISIANKITKGLIKNNHDVINFSYRNYHKPNLTNLIANNNLDQKIININENYRPDLIIFGHTNFLNRKSVEMIKKKYNCKISIWYEDALSKKGSGPSWSSNLRLIEKNNDLIDYYFTTTHPDEIITSIKKDKISFLPIIVDENIENLNLFNQTHKIKDLFFALSHGVNFGKLKAGKTDEREKFIDDLMIKFPDINYNILGYNNEEPKWNYDYFNELSKCKVALNLSRGKPLKYTSSNRLASLVGNGIYTFVNEKTYFSDFFNENEMGFYKNINDLGSKVEKIISNPQKLRKFSKNGKERYFELFNNKKITKQMINKIFNYD